jgi:hypothetical protein
MKIMMTGIPGSPVGSVTLDLQCSAAPSLSGSIRRDLLLTLVKITVLPFGGQQKITEKHPGMSTGTTITPKERESPAG